MPKPLGGWEEALLSAVPCLTELGFCAGVPSAGRLRQGALPLIP